MSAPRTPAEGAVFLATPAGVDHLRESIAQQYVLFEPRPLMPDTEVDFDWCRMDGTEPFLWDAPQPLPSAKRFFFQPRERLLQWSGESFVETIPDPPPFALFGMRSCDVTALAYQDRFFASDLYYVRRRERALIVGVNCLTACPQGFCKDVQAGPFARAGFDLNLTRLGDARVVVEIGTEQGKKVFEAAGLEPASLSQADLDAFGKVADAAYASFPDRPYVARAIARINAGHASREIITDSEWEALGNTCLACTGCTNLCPTCSCFTVIDEEQENGGERVRYWDSCLLEGFQREASGHHPSPLPGDRVRRFWYHKFSNDFLSDFERYGCVGCGRCDIACPGSIGATRVLSALGKK